MSRPVILVLLVVVVAIAVFAIDSFATQRTAEPTLHVAPGWQARLDAEPHGESTVVRFAEDGDGYLASNGPNVVFFREGQPSGERYGLSVSVQLVDSLHPHGAGLIFGGRDLSGPGQTYSYFLVREDGYFLIKTRRGDETAEVTPWTRHDAVRTRSGAEGCENRLRVEVGVAETRFLINDQEVHREPNAKLPVSGDYGFRMVHDLRVRFAELRCTPAQ